MKFEEFKEMMVESVKKGGGALAGKSFVPRYFINSMGNRVPNKIAIFINGEFWKYVDRLQINWSKAKTPMLLKVYENILEIHIYEDRVGFVTALQQDLFVVLYEQRVVGMHVDPKNFSTYKTKKVCKKEKAGLNFDLGYPSQRRVLLGALVALAHHIANDNDGFISYDEVELNHILPIRAYYESIWPQHVELVKHYKNVEHSTVWDDFKDNSLIIKRLSILDDSTFFEVYGKSQLEANEATLENYGLEFIYAENTEELIASGMKPSYIKDELYK